MVESLEVKPGVFQPVRVAISGTTVFARDLQSVARLGRDETWAHRQGVRGPQTPKPRRARYNFGGTVPILWGRIPRVATVLDPSESMMRASPMTNQATAESVVSRQTRATAVVDRRFQALEDFPALAESRTRAEGRARGPDLGGRGRGRRRIGRGAGITVMPSPTAPPSVGRQIATTPTPWTSCPPREWRPGRAERDLRFFERTPAGCDAERFDSMRSPPSGRGSPAVKWSSRTATSCSARRCSTTWASSCSPMLTGLSLTGSRRGAHSEERITESGWSWGSTTRWWAVLARRWALPNGSREPSSAITLRTRDEPRCAPGRHAGHYGTPPVNPKALLQAAHACDLSTGQLRASCTSPQGTGHAKPTSIRARSQREVEVVKRLAEGKVYKQSRRARALHEHSAPHLHNNTEARRCRPRPGGLIATSAVGSRG